MSGMRQWRGGKRAWALALFVLGALPAAAAAPACEDLSWDGPRKGAGLVIILSDTMRRDRLGAYGGPARTPAFDRFAAEHLLFRSAYTQAPWTTPSIATLLTSLYPSQHGVQSHPAAMDSRGTSRPDPTVDVLPAGLTTLPEVLQAAGYRTGAFVGNPWLEGRFGFAQGFDTYDLSFAEWDVPGEVIARAGLKWLQGVKKGDSFFLYLHMMDSHRPHPPLTPEELRARAAALAKDDRPLSPQAAQLVAKVVGLEPGSAAAATGVKPSVALLEMTYDRGVEAFDRGLQAFLEGFAKHPAFNSTAVIVTSDHGESLFDRGFGNHGNALYDDQVSIPLAARLPGVSADEGKVGCRLGLIDVLPTLCTYLGLACPEPIFGVSLLAPGADHHLADRYLVTEGVMHKPFNRAIRDARYKLVWQPARGPDGTGNMLFDLAADPNETRDLMDWEHRTEESARAYGRLTRAMATVVPEFTRPDSEKVPLTPEEIERLKALGYVQ